MKEAIGWSAFYIALPLAFGVWIWQAFGSQRGLEFYAGYLVEKSLSVDNLFVFMLLLSSFAVPRELQQRVLLIGVADGVDGALATVVAAPDDASVAGGVTPLQAVTSRASMTLASVRPFILLRPAGWRQATPHVRQFGASR